MPIRVMLPSGRVTTVDTDDPKVAAATARAFVAKDPYEATRAQLAQHPAAAAAAGGVETAVRGIPFLSELQAGINSGLDLGGDFLTGKQQLDPSAPLASLRAAEGKSWSKQRAIQQAYVDHFAAEHPVISNLTKGAAMAAPIATAIATGGASEAPAVAEAAPGVASFLKNAVTGVARRATAGAGAGAVYGAAQPGDLSQRAASAQQGAEVGAVVGGTLPTAAAAAGSVAKRAGTVIARTANKAAGGALLDANQVAAQRLTAALKADGATPDLVKTAMNGFLKNGATDPSLIDVASRLPSGGQNTLALVRGAAAKGSGRGVAVTYGDQVAADLQDKAIDRTRALTPDTRPAEVVKQELTDARGKAADAEYQAPYGVTVDATPVLPALDGDAGRVGIAGAYKDADALRLTDQQAELAKLRAAAGPEEPVTASIAGQEIPASPALAAKIQAAIGKDDTVPVSLGTLDRVKIALNDAGQAAARGGENSRAAGYFRRAGEIDDHLAGLNEDYASARDNYARRSAGIDAIDHGATGLNATPDDYAAMLDDLKAKGASDDSDIADPGATAGVGYRQALTDAIGRPAEGSTGVLNRIATATNQTRNLEATYGPDAAKTYQQGIQDLIDQMNNARFINPNTNSASAGRLMDAGLVDPPDIAHPRLSVTGVLLGAINKIRAGAVLTDAERAAIAQIGTAKPELGSIDLGDPALLPSQNLQNLQGLTAGSAAGGAQDQNKRITSQ